MSAAVIFIAIVAVVVGAVMIVASQALPTPQGITPLLAEIASASPSRPLEHVEYDALKILNRILRHHGSTPRADTLMLELISQGKLVLPEYAKCAAKFGLDQVVHVIATTQFERPLPNIPAGTGHPAPSVELSRRGLRMRGLFQLDLDFILRYTYLCSKLQRRRFMSEEHDLRPWSNAREALRWLYTALPASPGQTPLSLIEPLQAHLHSLGRELPSTVTFTDREDADVFTRRLEETASVLTADQLRQWDAWFEENGGDVRAEIQHLLDGVLLPLSLLPHVDDPDRLREEIRSLPL